jgi:hypothetical protein
MSQQSSVPLARVLYDSEKSGYIVAVVTTASGAVIKYCVSKPWTVGVEFKPRSAWGRSSENNVFLYGWRVQENRGAEVS